jgi:hypothetical protein
MQDHLNIVDQQRVDKLKQLLQQVKIPKAVEWGIVFLSLQFDLYLLR